MTQARWLLRGGRVLDPAVGRDEVADVLIDGGRIAAVGPSLTAAGARALDLGGRWVTPGFIDLHCHLREPGFEYKETVASGRAAAARGGFTTICAMPNTDPVIDNRSVVELVERAAAGPGTRVLVIGAITKAQRGEELAQMGELDEAGVVAFSDDGRPVANSRLMRHALEYARLVSRPVIDHCQDPHLAGTGVMNEGPVATRLGLPGAPAAAEELHIARDVLLAEMTGGWVHIAHLSTARGVALVRDAKRRGVRVTAEATPHHLTLTDDWILGHDRLMANLRGDLDPRRLLPAPDLGPYDTSTKVNPPLRTWTDVQAVIAGLADGTLDTIATDHAPHGAIDKECEYAHAAFGISGLETALGVLLHLVRTEQLPLLTVLRALTAAPAEIAGDRLPAGTGTLRIGAPADLIVIDPEAEWVVDPNEFASRGRNTPLAGVTLRGRVDYTWVAGELSWERADD